MLHFLINDLPITANFQMPFRKLLRIVRHIKNTCRLWCYGNRNPADHTQPQVPILQSIQCGIYPTALPIHIPAKYHGLNRHRVLLKKIKCGQLFPAQILHGRERIGKGGVCSPCVIRPYRAGAKHPACRVLFDQIGHRFKMIRKKTIIIIQKTDIICLGQRNPFVAGPATAPLRIGGKIGNIKPLGGPLYNRLRYRLYAVFYNDHLKMRVCLPAQALQR